MAKVILTTLLLASTSAFAVCPNLEGVFTYSGKTVLEVTQSVDAKNITTYKLTIDDGTCAACHTDQYLKADGIVKEVVYKHITDRTKIFCDNNRVKVRQVLEYYDNKGISVRLEHVQQDYRINDKNNLVIENLENEIPVSKVVYPRIK